MAAKFLPEDQSLPVCRQAAVQLREIEKPAAAAELLLQVGAVREAIEAFIEAEEWKKAKKVAVELDPDLESYVDDRYKDFLKNKGNIGQVSEYDR